MNSSENTQPKRWKRLIIGAILLTIGLLSMYFLKNYITLSPWNQTLALEYPSFVVAANDGSAITVDKSLRRVLKISSSGELLAKIDGGSREPGRFWFADEVATNASGHIFILNRIMDPPGFFTLSSEILEFDEKGQFVKTLFQKSYKEEERTPTLVQRGRAIGLHAFENRLDWFETSPTSLTHFTLSLGADNKLSQKNVLEGTNIDLLISSADVNEKGEVFYVLKTGLAIKLATDGTQTTLYDVKNYPGEFRQPWKIRANDEFTVISDLGLRSILKIDTVGTQVPLLNPDIEANNKLAGDSFYYTLSIGPRGEVGTFDSLGAYVVDAQNKVRFIESPSYQATDLIFGWLTWLAFLVAISGLVIVLNFLYRDVLKSVIPKFLKTVASIILLTALVGGVVASIILNNFQSRYQNEVLDKISQMANLVPDYIDVDKLMSISEPSQYLNDDYMSVRNQIIQAVYGKKNERNKGFYFAVHRIKGDGQIYTFMYLNGEPTIWHPFGYLNDPSLAYVPASKGESIHYSYSDPWGDWMLATAPIYDKGGKIVGVFEMGGDFYAFVQENNKLLQDLLWNIGTVLILILIGIVEFMFLSDMLNKKKQNEFLLKNGIKSQRSSDVFHRSFLTRPLMALFFFATSMSMLFLPHVAKLLLGQEANSGFLNGVSKEVIVGLPLSARLLMFGIGTIIAGMIVGRTGYKAVFGAGLLFSAIGLGVSAFTSDLTLFVAASAILGLGIGLCTIGLRSIINAETDEQVRVEGYSHYYSGLIAGTNIGVMVGSWLADWFGYEKVFLISMGTLILVVWAMYKLLPKKQDVPRQEIKAQKVKGSIRSFIMNPKVFLFFLLVIIPIYFISMMLGFVLPVFSAEQGISNADQGRIFLINGILIIYLGPLLTKLSQKIRSNGANLHISTLLWITSLIPFILSPNMLGMVLTIVLMGLAEAYAVPAQNNYFLSLPASQRLGSDKSSGIFEVFGKLGETIAPILLGLSMILGYQTGTLVVLLAVSLLYLIFLITKGKQEKIRANHE